MLSDIIDFLTGTRFMFKISEFFMHFVNYKKLLAQSETLIEPQVSKVLAKIKVLKDGHTYLLVNGHDNVWEVTFLTSDFKYISRCQIELDSSFDGNKIYSFC